MQSIQMTELLPPTVPSRTNQMMELAGCVRWLMGFGPKGHETQIRPRVEGAARESVGPAICTSTAHSETRSGVAGADEDEDEDGDGGDGGRGREERVRGDEQQRGEGRNAHKHPAKGSRAVWVKCGRVHVQLKFPSRPHGAAVVLGCSRVTGRTSGWCPVVGSSSSTPGRRCLPGAQLLPRNSPQPPLVLSETKKRTLACRPTHTRTHTHMVSPGIQPLVNLHCLELIQSIEGEWGRRGVFNG
ncbi:hypothetical protein B0O80DRAFT_308547 [Mortierella sp. GBAus27b]|nr:hypothetical protein B0O80DRAFT_308547 [Mortierella sp. GBAus27b]